MPFIVPEHVLIRLRAHRDQRRQARAQRAASQQARERSDLNFIDALRRLLSGRDGVDEAASAYVGAMDSWENELEVAHNAFLLDPGMGPMLYLTADGRVLEDSRGWDGDSVVELDGDGANAAIVIGAKKTGIVELLDLLPARPPEATICPKCQGTRMCEPMPGFGAEHPCATCGSRGWIGAA